MKDILFQYNKKKTYIIYAHVSRVLLALFSYKNNALDQLEHEYYFT